MAATAADFARWADYARRLPTAAVLFAANDAGETARIADSFDPAYAGLKADECATYRAELRRRGA